MVKKRWKRQKWNKEGHTRRKREANQRKIEEMTKTKKKGEIRRNKRRKERGTNGAMRNTPTERSYENERTTRPRRE